MTSLKVVVRPSRELRHTCTPLRVQVFLSMTQTQKHTHMYGSTPHTGVYDQDFKVTPESFVTKQCWTQQNKLKPQNNLCHLLKEMLSRKKSFCVDCCVYFCIIEEYMFLDTLSAVELPYPGRLLSHSPECTFYPNDSLWVPMPVVQQSLRTAALRWWRKQYYGLLYCRWDPSLCHTIPLFLQRLKKSGLLTLVSWDFFSEEAACRQARFSCVLQCVFFVCSHLLNGRALLLNDSRRNVVSPLSTDLFGVWR